MDAAEDYDEVFEFWIPGVCLSGKIEEHHQDIHENITYVILLFAI